ncbi:MAG: hypothetical protein BIFFINMI_02104 [Phycisphaerae bacterium]|nr:hypothetical protein [Phycisphaerae bacterium]
MDYRGAYPIFDLSHMRTYPLKGRHCKREVDGFVNVAALAAGEPAAPAMPWFRNGQPGPGADQSAGLAELADYVVRCRREGRPVIAISGAHPIKNGLSPIYCDLIGRGLISLLSTNVAATIHSFELALQGASSEEVRDALPRGQFGMAFETGHYLNYALKLGAERGLGYGECVGRLLCDAAFRRAVIDAVFADHADTGGYYKPYEGFEFADSCVFAAAHRAGIPITVHASLGYDIIDQHDSFDGAAKGATSGADFLVFTEHVAGMTGGGVILNFGSAIMAPEVCLKAVAMAANSGRPPAGLWTGNFDLQPFGYAHDETRPAYYRRDQKSISTRIPGAFGGAGFYFQGPHDVTMSAFYQHLLRAAQR